jgi:hypothetical protein
MSTPRHGHSFVAMIKRRSYSVVMRRLGRAAVALAAAASAVLSAGQAKASTATGKASAQTLVVSMEHEQWIETPTGYVIGGTDYISGKDAGSSAVDCRANPVSQCFADFNLPDGSFYVAVTLRSGGGGSGRVLYGTGSYAKASATISAADTSNTTTVVTVRFKRL